ncbi:MAG TPA: MFS transporter [Solirubrobacteraceae bacterium]|jgi:EmrB/QacA subfamily drug resistance transporter|nr:MFS transporter [Solirubrobacteraceae bacterium]
MPSRIRLHDGNRHWWTLAAMCFALFMIMLDNTVVNVALPSIQRDLHATTSSLEWTVNAYTLSFAVLLVTAGRLGDLFGRRRMFLFGVVVFGVSSFLIGLAQSDTWLVAFRALQGVGSGFMMPATLSIITNTFPPQERGRAIGTWAGVSAMALAIGPVVGGVLVQEVSWQSIFFLNVPVAAVAVIVTLFATRESRDENAKRVLAEVDLPGVAAITVGLASLVLALVESNSWGWGSGRVIALFAVALVALSSFAWIERRRRFPMVDFAFFRSRTFFGANLVAFVVSFAMLAMFFYLALYMQDILHYSPIQAGLRFLPSTIVVMITGPIAGRLADRVGSRRLMTAGLLLVAFAMFWMTGIRVDTGYGFLLVPFLAMGLGIGLVMSPMSTAAMNSVDQARAGVASGILSMVRMVGGTFGVALMGAIIATLGRDRLTTLLPQLSAAKRARLVEALGSGASGGHLPAVVQQATSHTYVYALSNALFVAGGLATLGAVAAWVLVRPSAAHIARGAAQDAAPGQAAVEGAEGSRESEPVAVA